MLYTLEESTVDNAVQGVCWVDDCGECTVWYHANDYQDRSMDPFSVASEMAETEIQEHLLEAHNLEV
jgi:hypothetical protein